MEGTKLTIHTSRDGLPNELWNLFATLYGMNPELEFLEWESLSITIEGHGPDEQPEDFRNARLPAPNPQEHQ